MIVAPGCPFTTGSKAATTRSTPMMLVSTIDCAADTSQPSVAMSSAREMPALAINTLRSGKRARTSPTSRVSDIGSSRSRGRPTTSGRPAVISSSSCWRRPVTMTRLPLSWKASARPRPMPLVPPVIRMVLPVMRMMLVLRVWFGSANGENEVRPVAPLHIETSPLGPSRPRARWMTVTPTAAWLQLQT